jgi:putative endonuclease
MTTERQKFGETAESMAAKFIEKQGYKILKRNYTTKLGEIDIIAKEKDTLVFIEVKARKSGKYVNPKAAVTRTKQRKISMVALYYLKKTNQTGLKARFDVVAVSSLHNHHEIELIKNAFELAYS